jgi:hypothetical protein
MRCRGQCARTIQLRINSSSHRGSRAVAHSVATREAETIRRVMSGDAGFNEKEILSHAGMRSWAAGCAIADRPCGPLPPWKSAPERAQGLRRDLRQDGRWSLVASSPEGTLTRSFMTMLAFPFGQAALHWVLLFGLCAVNVFSRATDPTLAHELIKVACTDATDTPNREAGQLAASHQHVHQAAADLQPARHMRNGQQRLVVPNARPRNSLQCSALLVDRLLGGSYFLPQGCPPKPRRIL